MLTLLLSGNTAEPALPQEIAELAPDRPPAAIVEEVAAERWLYIRGALLEQQTLFLPEKQAYLCQVLLPSGTSREDWAGAALQLHARYLIEKSVERGTISLNGEGEVLLSDAPAEVVLTLQ